MPSICTDGFCVSALGLHGLMERDTMKGITKDWHLLLDAAYIPVVAAAPAVLKFEENKAAATLCKAASGLVLGYSLLTDAKGSPAKIIPYKTHAALDFASGMLSLAAPWAFGFADRKPARNTLLAMGVVGLVVGALSWIGAKKE